jgi:hypothetical protein
MTCSNPLHTPLVGALHLLLDHFIYSHVNLTFKQLALYLNFSACFMKSMIILREKDKIMKQVVFCGK